MTAESSLSPSAKLCLSCGLCCNGALFPHAYFVFGENLSHWQSKGFDLVEEDGSLFFELGCPHLDGAACTIYDQPRPHTCGGFRCKPLQQLEDKEIGFDQALATIRKAVQLSDAVRMEAKAAEANLSCRNYYTLRGEIEDIQSENSEVGTKPVSATLAKLDAFEAYANSEIMPDHVLEELAEGNQS